MNNQKFDTIVIGSGLGALSYAAIRTSKGSKILVLEKANEPGGCASSYTKDGYRFEAGATTLVGFEKNLPLQRLFQELKVDISALPLRMLNPAMRVYLHDSISLSRNSDRKQFVQECISKFGEEKAQKRFWKLIFYLADQVWNVSARFVHFPPRSGLDWIRLLFQFKIKDIVIFGFSLLSMATLLRLPGFPRSNRFQKFLDEQLLITVQTKSDGSPVTMGAAGITYAHLKNYYLDNGIGSLAKFLVEYIRNNQGEVHLLEEVTSIDILTAERKPIFSNPFIKNETKYSIATRRNKVYESKELVSGIPIWNIEKLLDSPSQSSSTIISKLKREIQKRSNAFSKGIWGAFNIAMVVQDFLVDDPNIHFQFHLDSKLPHGCGDSIFISVSHSEDKTRCNIGQRVLAISTHVENPHLWSRKDEDYKSRKLEITEAVIQFLESHWQGFDRKKILYQNSASPASWVTWTGRSQGRVGGIPASYFFNPFRFPSSFLKSVNGFYLLGDTVYPGQGIPAVVLGALNLSKRLS
ncbi:phytoene desaturase family protein [Leptospira sp. GIMC2001]|uniref:phytoene desaturase family protein n=1 Tax=Leptospira sp. GIMC2001 TaxID=1513297 RepID=UPI002349F5EB|nr:NAD(P)/FAD-dependent oxidoreductase [Leptospira sp. GIMC2001]WCL50293.1 NAD(P)/FAD-dependent oxidoreductase [Leptospira sp. GIMC2001]